jgi:lysophospholipase L1-like esterase
VSPVIRPDAEATPNRVGATLAALRAGIEDTVQARREAGDAHLELVPGQPLLTAEHLPDGIHPGDEGHAILAARIGAVVTSIAHF